ncbi:sigma-70 family RNA polymerase sigma factor [Luteimonas sp. SJ-92]|uniref:Sigma-70 family RNA polymerase sigma factor n=1 Tax=Luteimonas salinisoli TaxID=2752307 RepID=A0A853J998_9GAMM|nr:sigma-70 family RNA polymerase sigma factor [Luteimonas salinisoli]NZA25766.1 sigma-70 family RNA polymerase sigma factor [Luteimonas salinisoli]
MSSEITRLLQRHHRGDRAAFDRMVPLVYERLRIIARGQIARAGRRGQTLDTTALVQEAYLQLVDEDGVDWQDRGHFFAICARAMRRILVDYARRRHAAKRGGGVAALTLQPDLVALDGQSQTILAVDEALEGLAAFNPRLAQVVECRYFGGMTEEETARALGTSLRTVQRDWMRARAWLLKELAPA